MPVGLENDIQLNSSWPHPSFVGRFLPDQTHVSAQGFTSRWRVSDLATGGDDGVLSEKLSGNSGERYATARHVNMSGLATTLGVSLLDPVDNYTQADRAVRYGFMFVLLTFGGFFLFEARKGQRIHSIQYLLVGFAVTLFFLLLVALSEHVVFAQAYLIAATACVGLLTAYGRYVLGHWGRAAVFGSAYVLFYGGMYVLLSSEDYAFLMGAWLVFGLLALAMFMTRKLDWHRFGEAMVRRDAQEIPPSESRSC